MCVVDVASDVGFRRSWYCWKACATYFSTVQALHRGEQAIFRYELTPDGDSTHVLVTYRRITKQTARGFLPGLHAFLDRLEAQLNELQKTVVKQQDQIQKHKREVLAEQERVNEMRKAKDEMEYKLRKAVSVFGPGC